DLDVAVDEQVLLVQARRVVHLDDVHVDPVDAHGTDPQRVVRAVHAEPVAVVREGDLHLVLLAVGPRRPRRRLLDRISRIQSPTASPSVPALRPAALPSRQASSAPRPSGLHGPRGQASRRPSTTSCHSAGSRPLASSAASTSSSCPLRAASSVARSYPSSGSSAVTRPTDRSTERCRPAGSAVMPATQRCASSREAPASWLIESSRL